jgi:hypothetical protein
VLFWYQHSPTDLVGVADGDQLADGPSLRLPHGLVHREGLGPVVAALLETLVQVEDVIKRGVDPRTQVLPVTRDSSFSVVPIA